ncbi:hypothetical protein K402DRAFT_391621 [Aulographum hederae CBS 113979]|uniref:TPR-like protein n=1 Tax=Aulographum hederae CBS 113979 TaxID=1176131 RepID=A0A6G1H785_9PEZI|nr:hypothetical protein K402DRAFT_391621 [Aulographum hederae CBS 113979]
MSTLGDSKPFRFLDLPAEIRESVYGFVLKSDYIKQELEDGQAAYNFDLKLFLVNRQVYYEARKVFRKENIFVRVETPWPEAQHHVADQGNVPLITTGESAEKFQDHRFGVLIDAPQYHLNFVPIKFVVLVQDIELFTTMWFYSDLSHPGLNQHLRLTLEIRRPFIDPPGVPNNSVQFAAEAQPEVPNVVQKRFFESFGRVKELHEVRVFGDHNGTLVKAMRDEMAKPSTSPEDCLEATNTLKKRGNEEFKKQNYQLAEQLYYQAFKAMHIIIMGRKRAIWGDAYFVKPLESGSFVGQQGHMIRIMLRVQLVSNVMQVFCKQQRWEDARYWGMRSIQLMRNANAADEEDDNDNEVELDDVILNGMPGADSVGKIYYRTAIACRELDDKSQARKLLKVAIQYLPHDPLVHKAQASVALQLG